MGKSGPYSADGIDGQITRRSDRLLPDFHGDFLDLRRVFCLGMPGTGAFRRIEFPGSVDAAARIAPITGPAGIPGVDQLRCSAVGAQRTSERLRQAGYRFPGVKFYLNTVALLHASKGLDSRMLFHPYNGSLLYLVLGECQLTGVTWNRVSVFGWVTAGLGAFYLPLFLGGTVRAGMFLGVRVVYRTDCPVPGKLNE